MSNLKNILSLNKRIYKISPMDLRVTIEELDAYLNKTLSTYLGYPEVYTIEVDVEGNKISFVLIASEGYSVISAMALSEEPEDIDIIAQIEGSLTDFILKKFPNVIEQSVDFNYDYNSIIIRFELQ